MVYKNILCSTENGACWIRFNRPTRRNAISFDTYTEIIDAMKKAEQDPSVAVTVFTGVGEFYSSGNDFHPDEMMRNFEQSERGGKPPFANLVDALIDHSKPLIALVNGPVIGIACTTLGLFELVIAADTAFFSTPFPQLGVCPEGCSSVTFPMLMGYTKASRMLTFGEQLSAREAYEAGLIAKVVPKDRFVAETEAFVKKVAQYPKQSMIVSKRLMRDGEMARLLHKVNDIETAAVAERISSPETTEQLLKSFSKKAKL